MFCWYFIYKIFKGHKWQTEENYKPHSEFFSIEVTFENCATIIQNISVQMYYEL